MLVKKLFAHTVIIAVLLLCAFFWQEKRVEQERARTSAGTPAVSVPIREQADRYKKPLSGKKGNLTASELAWMLRERISLGVMYDMIGEQRDAAAYNERKDRYNELAGHFEYLESDMAAAIKLVESDREAIVSEAANRALAAKNTIWKAQQLLHLRGLYLAKPTGKMDRNTSYAVKTYQLQRKEPQTGIVDEKLINALKRDYLREKSAEEAVL